MWLVRPFWLIYNIDPAILEKCPKKEKIILTLLGVITFITYLTASFSTGYLSYLATEKVALSVVIGAILGWNFLNLYRLILITFDMPPEGKPNTKIGAWISLLIRAIFLLLLIIIIIKPLELLYFNDAIEQRLEEVVVTKERQLNDKWLRFIDDKITFYQLAIQNNQKEILRKQETLESESDFNTDLLVELSDQRIEALQEQIDDLQEIVLWFQSTRIKYVSEFKETADSSLYLIERLKILLFSFPESWLMTFVLGVFFLIPILVKISVMRNYLYYWKETKAAQNLILQEYSSFKMHYQQVLYDTTGKDIQYHETYADPPFNTKLIKERQDFKDHQDFENWASKYY